MLIVFRQVTDDDNCDFVAICNVMSKVTEEPVDIFWLTSRFYRLRCRSTDMIIIMVRSFVTIRMLIPDVFYLD